MPGRRQHTRAEPGRSVLPPLLLGALALVGWQLLAISGWVDPRLLPTPLAVLGSLAELIGTGDLGPAVLTTLTEALAGSALGIVVGVPLAFAIVHLPRFGAAIEPFLAASQAVPAIAIAPLLVLWAGYGLTSIAILCALLVFFPIVLSTTLGLRHLDPDVLAAARTDGAGGADLIRYLEFPMALPSILSGIRNGLTLAVTGAIVGEFVMGGEGLGLLLVTQRDRVDTAGLFATLVVLGALAMAAHALIRVLENRTRI